MGNEVKLGKVLIHLTSTDSTNDYLFDLLAKNNPIPGTVISAGFQVHGRGQYGNYWQSEAAKNLLLSVFYKPTNLRASHSFFLNMVATLAVCKLTDSIFGEPLASIKWPNDILVEGQKLGGILIKNTISGKFIQGAVIGIGLNVNQTNFALVKGDYQPVSLVHVLGKNLERGELLFKLIALLEGEINSGVLDPENCERRFLNRLSLNEGAIKVQNKDSGRTVSGELLEINSRGEALVLVDGRKLWIKVNDWKMIHKHD